MGVKVVAGILNIEIGIEKEEEQIDGPPEEEPKVGKYRKLHLA